MVQEVKTSQSQGGKRLGTMLLERGAITGEQLMRAISSQQSVGGRIGTCLLEMDVLNEEMLLDTLSQQLSVPAAPVTHLRQIDHEVLGLVPAQVAQRCQAVPFASSDTEVQVAILDVHDLSTLDELAFCTSKRVLPHIANEARVFQALERHYGHPCPSRYTHLLDRLERQSYRWHEGALMPDGGESNSNAWTPSPSNGRPKAPTTHEIPTVATAEIPTLSADDPALLQEDAPTDPLAGLEPLVARRPDPEAPPVDHDADDVSTQEVRKDDPVLFGKPVEPVGDMTQARRPPSPFGDIERLLSDQSDREVIGQVLLRTLSVAFRRSALFKVRKRRLRGWLARGDGFDPQLFAELELSLEDSSVFRHLQQGSEIYIGPLPHSPAHRRMACTWGGDLPKDCLMMPVRVRDRMVCVVYVDNGPEGLLQPDVDGLRHLVHRASMAFEWCILLKKSQQQSERGR